MRIQVIFNSTPVLVPCGDGHLTVGELIQKAIVRFKKVVNKVSAFPLAARLCLCPSPLLSLPSSLALRYSRSLPNVMSVSVQRLGPGGRGYGVGRNAISTVSSQRRRRIWSRR